MRIRINDQAVELTEGSTVAQALAKQSIESAGIAVAVNGAVIAKTAYDSHTLNHGDSLIIIKAFYGG